MRDRIGVVRRGLTADGSRQLILPSGEIAVIGVDLADAAIADRFDLDAVRHADGPDWCCGVCRDGLLVGTAVYTVNRIGSKVLIALPPRPGGMVVEYEVTQVSTDTRLADLHIG